MYVFHIDSVDIDSIECIRGPCLVVSTVSTNIAFNALHALMFVSTVSTNKISYSIHNNSIALIFLYRLSQHNL